MEQNQSNWGGARKGAGRKKKYVKTYFFGATAEAHAILEALEGDRTAFINRAIVAYASEG